MKPSIRLAGISGSLRRASKNTGILRALAERLPAGVEMALVDLQNVPFYNQDLKNKPESVYKALEQMQQADALVLACPEYNYSVAPALKNILDWASREPENGVLNGKPVAIVGAGGGMGTSRAQYHLRQICTGLNLRPLNRPEFFSNAFQGAYTEDGELQDAKLLELLDEVLKALITVIGAPR